MKKILCFMVVTMFAITASAQITWNLKAGFGIASCIFSDDVDAEDSKVHFVGKLGAGMEYPITSNFSLMPSAEFALKGVKFDYEDRYYSYEETVDLYYFQIPVLAAYRFNLTDHLNLVAKAGPYFAFGFYGSVEGNGSDGDSLKEDVFSEDIGGKRFELGLDLGVDFEFKRFVVGAEYEFGFTPLLKNDNASARNSAFYVTVGYKF